MRFLAPILHKSYWTIRLNVAKRDRGYNRGYGYGERVVRRTKDGTRRFICLVFLRGIRERASDTWYPYRHHHLIEAKQSDETNKREGMRAPSPLPSSLSPLRYFVQRFFSPPSSHFVSPRLFLQTPRPSFLATFALDPLIPISEDRIPVQT